MLKVLLPILTFFALILFGSQLRAQEKKLTLTLEEDKMLQEKLDKAMLELKQEIRATVKVKNPGAISGKVKCMRARHSGDTVIYIETVGDNKYDPPEERGIMDQIKLIFVPHVLAVQRGTTIDFLNSDLIRHNVFSPPDCCNQFNLGTYAPGIIKSATLDKTCEVPILCNIHTEMSAFVLVLDNPYFAVTSKDGSFTIDDVPPGTYKLKTWHEKRKSETQEVTVDSGKLTEVNFMLK